ncbi:hypothetical protein [Nonomuraea sp. NPDC049480]|uniref:hypothetical protein n=1 Tax=Nonomuraea sp. NPDC049480 TaxID=3364353 RepID=UPI00378CD3A7
MPVQRPPGAGVTSAPPGTIGGADRREPVIPSVGLGELLDDLGGQQVAGKQRLPGGVR